jgi:hypothetical protein
MIMANPMAKYAAWTLMIVLSVAAAIAGMNAVGAYRRPAPAHASSKKPSRADRAAAAPPIPALHVPWPAGWDVTADHGSLRPYAVQETAMLNRHGKMLAAINASIGRLDASESLQSFLETLVEGETRSARKRGSTLTVSPLKEGTWKGQPSLQYEERYTEDGTKFRLRRIVTRGSAGLTCMVVLNAAETRFEKYVATLEKLRDQFPCP